jgi:hypothetical protein
VWGGREGANSISDAEQLLCIVLPATTLTSFALDNPDNTLDDVRDALRALGNASEIPRRLVGVLTEYFERYSAEDGTPLFHGGSYFAPAESDEKPATAQLELDVVESYAVSITLTLAAISFARTFGTIVKRPESVAEVTRLEQLASRRLTGAMVGLLRSFTINAFDVDDDKRYGRSLMAMANQGSLPDRQFTTEFSRQLRDVTAGLRDLTIGSGLVRDLDSPGRLYECGWSWGVIEGAPEIDFVQDPQIVQRKGYAQDAPYLYFSVVALDGLADLFAPRTRRQGLLSELQLRLANALNIRWDMTQAYWAAIATFGGGRWPLEDLPWLTTDGVESDYFSLLVTSMSARDLAERRGTDIDLSRLGQVLTELANRARITRRPFQGDVGVGVHFPGIRVSLDGTELYGPKLSWQATDFAPLLLKRSVRVAELINDIELRRQLLELIDEVWDHVLKRRHVDIAGGDTWRGLWDQPANVFSSITERYDQPSWHHTVRVVESLLFSATMTTGSPLRDEGISAFAANLLAEADHLLDQEQLAGSTEAGPQLRGEIQSVRSSIDRAREIVFGRPGSATALLLEALRKLDQLAAARQGPPGVT